jgi:peroxiredoxin
MTTRIVRRQTPPRGRNHAGRTGHGPQQSRARVAAQQATRRQRQRQRILLWSGVLVAVAVLIGAMMWTARTTTNTTSRLAPDFTLTDTNGATVRLADYRGHNVVLYFSEGAGCQSCLYQMADIEHNAAQFTAANVVVLPIVMNTPAQIRADMAADGVHTPFLIDTNGTVSAEYGTLGKGMHAGLPGHSFVLIDTTGVQRWYGEYASMYLSSAALLNQVRTHLPA